MRVLLTRPAPEGVRTKARLEALGHHVWVSPVTRIVACEADWPEDTIDVVAATSAHAFVSAGPFLPPEARRLMPLLLVGERTREVARNSGWTGPAIVASTAVDLVAEMAQTRRNHRIVYLAGRDRKPTLEDGLRDQGHSLTTIETYAALAAEELEPSCAKALRAGALDAVLHFSRRSAAIFLDLAEAAQATVAPVRHICLSPDVATPLRDADCNNVVIAASPDEASLIACLQSAELQA